MRQIAAKAALIVGNILVYLRYPASVLRFYRRLGYLPNVCDPKTKGEKFLWRKTFDRNPMYRLLADKLAVRQFVKMHCPELGMSEIIWTGSAPEQIPDTLLQPGIVIKTNNGCNRNVFITNIPTNRVLLNRQIAKWLARPYGVTAGEWVYSGFQPYVFIERMVASSNDGDFADLCFHVLMGRCLLATVDKNVKQDSERIAVYDPDGNRLAISFRESVRAERCKELPKNFRLPVTFRQAVRYAEIIGRDFDYVRVDFMSSGDRLYFGECTIFPMGGFSIISGGADERITTAWDLRKSWFMRNPQRGPNRVYAKLYHYCLNKRDAPQRGHCRNR